MVSVWPRSGHYQAERFSTALHHKADQPYPRDPSSLPCSPEMRCLKGMNPQVEALVPTREARSFFVKDMKRSTGKKSSTAIRSSWSILPQVSQGSHQKYGRRPSKVPDQDSQRLLNTPKKRNMLKRWKRGSPRAKRSVIQGVPVQYTGFKDAKFRIQGDFPFYLTPTPGNSLGLSTQHLNHSCYRAHTFEELTTSTEGGLTVMLQAHTGRYLHANSSGFLSFMDSEAGAATVTQIDNRFFRLHSYVGESMVRIKHIMTDLHLQARGAEVFLVSTNPLAAAGMHFHEYSCSTT